MLFFSKDSASVAAVIPTMDWLTETLNQWTRKAYYPAITAAMKLAYKKMDRYYSLIRRDRGMGKPVDFGSRVLWFQVRVKPKQTCTPSQPLPTVYGFFMGY